MKIEIIRKSEELLESGRYRSLDEIIAAAAGPLPSAESELTSMPDHIEVDDFAKREGIGVLEDFRKLKADFWPQDETAEEFLSAIHHGRDDNQPRVN